MKDILKKSNYTPGLRNHLYTVHTRLSANKHRQLCMLHLCEDYVNLSLVDIEKGITNMESIEQTCIEDLELYNQTQQLPAIIIDSLDYVPAPLNIEETYTDKELVTLDKSILLESPDVNTASIVIPIYNSYYIFDMQRSTIEDRTERYKTSKRDIIRYGLSMPYLIQYINTKKEYDQYDMIIIEEDTRYGILNQTRKTFQLKQLRNKVSKEKYLSKAVSNISKNSNDESTISILFLSTNPNYIDTDIQEELKNKYEEQLNVKVTYKNILQEWIYWIANN